VSSSFRAATGTLQSTHSQANSASQLSVAMIGPAKAWPLAAVPTLEDVPASPRDAADDDKPVLSVQAV